MGKILLFVLLSVNICFAQIDKAQPVHPDFSGLWVFQSVSSKPKSDSKISHDTKIQLTYTEPQLILQVKERSDGQDVSSSVATYYTDERGDKNRLESKTKWDGKKIVIKYPNENMQVVLELSPDGSRLTETVTLKTSIKISMFGKEETRTEKTETKTIYVKQT